MRITNRIKSFLALIVCVTVLFSVSVPSGFASASAGGATVSESREAYDFLKAVGAIDKNEQDFNAELKISRAYFIKLALHLSNDAPNVISSQGDVFADVKPGSEYEAYIETAARIGYISGNGSNLFNPSNIITVEQAIKILVNILGYGRYAEALGGFPTGYTLMANRSRITDGMVYQGNAELTMSDAMILLKNTANAEIMQIVSIGDDIEMKTVDGQTLLYKNHGVDYIEGIMNANGYTDLLSTESELGRDQVAVSDVVFNTATKDIQNYLGYNVRLYFDNDSGNKTKTALYVHVNDENTVTELLTKDTEISGGEITYYEENDKCRTLSLSSSVSYILNGKMAFMTPESIVNVPKSTLKLISNNGDKLIDVVHITGYTTSVVSGVSQQSNVIASHDGTRIYLDPLSDEYSFSVWKNGKEAAISDIVADDIILVSEGAGEGYRHIEVLACSDKTEGTIDEIGEDYIIVQGQEYNFDSVIGTKIQLGRQYVMLLDIFGNISDIKVENDVVYGFLYAIDKQGMSAPKCRIFTENGRWVNLDFADRVKFNGTYVTSVSLYNTLLAMGNGYKELIRYNVNSNAELINLETYQDIPISSENEQYAIENDVFRLSCHESLTYRNSPKSFNGVFFVDPNAIIFSIPRDMSEHKFRVKDISVFKTDTRYDITAFNTDKYLTSNLLLAYDLGVDKDISNTDKFMIVDGTGRIVNTDGEDVPSLRGWWNDSMISFPVKVGEDGISQSTFDNLEKGDVILFKYDEGSNIISVTEYPAAGKYYTSTSSVYSSCTIIGGEVSDIDIANKKIRIQYTSSGKETGVIYTDSTTATIWDKNTDTQRIADISEIIPGDIVFVNTRYLNCHDIVIIRN